MRGYQKQIVLRERTIWGAQHYANRLGFWDVHLEEAFLMPTQLLTAHWH